MSGTILTNRKLKFRTLLLALALSVHSVKGKASCQLKRELGVDYKTAFVLLHKLREAIVAQRDGLQLGGTVEADGMSVSGHVRPENKVEDRVDRRYDENTTGGWWSWRCASAVLGPERWPCGRRRSVPTWRGTWSGATWCPAAAPYVQTSTGPTAGWNGTTTARLTRGARTPAPTRSRAFSAVPGGPRSASTIG